MGATLSPLVLIQERLLSRQGQQGWNQLFDLLQAELTARPADAHVNVKLVQLFCQDGRLDEAVKHCLAAEKRGLLRNSLHWYTVVLHTLQVRMYFLIFLAAICSFISFFFMLQNCFSVLVVFQTSF